MKPFDTKYHIVYYIYCQMSTCASLLNSELWTYGMFKLIKQNLIKFIILWFTIFLVSFYILSFFGLVPEEERVEEIILEDKTEQTLEEKLSFVTPVLPEKVVIDEIGVDVVINNPESRDIDVLDQSLSNGAVRYPSSGLLGEKTNILLFGHSSNLPVIRNTNYKAFNKLDKLEIGNKVSVLSNTHEFVYTVTSVEEADAENALVVFESDKREITLSTCNTFGDLNDRFVVKADLFDVVAI
jgi:LPXTG-site transpeptidase (sortase) family protein